MSKLLKPAWMSERKREVLVEKALKCTWWAEPIRKKAHDALVSTIFGAGALTFLVFEMMPSPMPALAFIPALLISGATAWIAKRLFGRFDLWTSRGVGWYLKKNDKLIKNEKGKETGIFSSYFIENYTYENILKQYGEVIVLESISTSILPSIAAHEFTHYFLQNVAGEKRSADADFIATAVDVLVSIVRSNEWNIEKFRVFLPVPDPKKDKVRVSLEDLFVLKEEGGWNGRCYEAASRFTMVALRYAEKKFTNKEEREFFLAKAIQKTALAFYDQQINNKPIPTVLRIFKQAEKQTRCSVDSQLVRVLEELRTA